MTKGAQLAIQRDPPPPICRRTGQSTVAHDCNCSSTCPTIITGATVGISFRSGHVIPCRIHSCAGAFIMILVTDPTPRVYAQRTGNDDPHPWWYNLRRRCSTANNSVCAPANSHQHLRGTPDVLALDRGEMGIRRQLEQLKARKLKRVPSLRY